jgi:hypothetical protein
MAKNKKVVKKSATKKKAASKYTEKFKINASFDQILAMTFDPPKK